MLASIAAMYEWAKKVIIELVANTLMTESPPQPSSPEVDEEDNAALLARRVTVKLMERKCGMVYEIDILQYLRYFWFSFLPKKYFTVEGVIKTLHE